MKHNLFAISILVTIFLLAQVVGLAVTAHYLEKPELPMNIERPVVPEKQQSYTFIPIFIFILIATALGLLLIKFSLLRFWKFWFFSSVALCLTISLSAFVPNFIAEFMLKILSGGLSAWISSHLPTFLASILLVILPDLPAISLAIILASFKVFKPNVFVHNFTEIFIYGALAAIFVPILNVTAVIVLLLLISIYDFIAVRKTKHMVKLAKFQGKSKMFAGLLLPYKRKMEKAELSEQRIAVGKRVNVPKAGELPKEKAGVAILGGGDIGFPLLFAGAVMKQFGLGLFDYRIFIVPFFAAVSLLLLFLFASNKKFYPAMPYISAGCFAGYGIVWLLV